MPIYLFHCDVCGEDKERLLEIESPNPMCCGQTTRKMPTCFAMVKMKGEGGYPSRRKFVKGTAPGATRNTKAWLETDPYESTARNQDWGREALSEPSSL